MTSSCCLLGTLVVLVAVCQLGSALSGPFLLWGEPRLKYTEVGALAQLDQTRLGNIYADAESILVFVRNATVGRPIRANDYPAFEKLLHEQDSLYLSSGELSLDPIESSANAELINLVGSTAQQDVEIVALYNDAVATYGAGKVLGILASGTDGPKILGRHRRDDSASDGSTTEASAAYGAETTGSPPTDEPMEENFVYIASGKAMMYTTAPPLLDDGSNTFALRKHGLVTSDERKDELMRLIVSFTTDDVQKLVLRFRFPISGGYWTLASVELEEMLRAGESPRKTELLAVGEAPTAPLGFSYKCSSAIVFRHNSTTLRLENVQVQPMLVDARAFSDAYDCVGFVTGGILSGFFVVTILTAVMFLALACIWDIKAPTKFENSRGKQLTFSTQD